LHEQFSHAEEKLLQVVNDTCVRKQGKLIIPSFAIGRTQDIVHTLNNFYNAGLLPKIQIYVDSPLAVNATTIFRLHSECFNDEVLKVVETDDDPFGFNSLHYITATNESKKLNSFKKPCIIISASGMMEAGRIKHHLANNISNPNNTILVVGYCAPRTLGARLVNGEKTVSIFGNKYQVNAEIARIEAFSGHGDYKEMLSFLDCQDQSAIKKVFLVHGDYDAQLSYKEQMEAAGFTNIEIPEPMSEYTI
jgi:metallo-beta-lactamase family protein